MSFKYNKELRRPFVLADVSALVTTSGSPVKILMVLDDVHHCSSVVFKWAQLDVEGNVINWHVSTATQDGICQLGAGHRLYSYDGDIELTPTKLEIW